MFGSKFDKVFKALESFEILKILGLIKSMEEYEINISLLYKKWLEKHKSKIKIGKYRQNKRLKKQRKRNL